MYLIRILFLLCIYSFVFPVLANDVIRSSVSPDFINGLHSKYLRNIAKHMGMEIEITPMPFARRIRALRTGEIDLMVGLQRDKDEQDEIIYLFPSYESLRQSFFLLQENLHKLKSFDDLQNLNIGVTVHARYFERFNQQADLAMVETNSLTQKIDLLRKGRIDTFVHVEESTQPRLKKMGLSNAIVLAGYQPMERFEYFVTMSQYSPLFDKKPLFEKAIKKALANNDFSRIREEHYKKQDCC